MNFKFLSILNVAVAAAVFFALQIRAESTVETEGASALDSSDQVVSIAASECENNVSSRLESDSITFNKFTNQFFVTIKSLFNNAIKDAKELNSLLRQ